MSLAKLEPSSSLLKCSKRLADQTDIIHNNNVHTSLALYLWRAASASRNNFVLEDKKTYHNPLNLIIQHSISRKTIPVPLTNPTSCGA
jgi:hypothetical protein